MEIVVSSSKSELGKKAAITGAELIRNAIANNGKANVIVATGASQFEMLDELIKQDVEWPTVTAFHLDEYIGISEKHPASFRKYLKERFVDKLDLCSFHYVDGKNNPELECRRLGLIIKEHPIDVAFIGIGENGHLAFNDPPADFNTEDAYHVVHLDDKCRRQQLGEGWFESLKEIPEHAISMSIKQIMKSKSIICSVPDARKAKAIEGAVEGIVSPHLPASILQEHGSTWLFLDKESSSQIQASPSQ